MDRRLAVGFLGLGLTLSGCADIPAAETESILPTEPVRSPLRLEPGRLALLGPSGEIKPGMTSEEVDRVFPAPPGAFALRELPPGFNPPYKARGFETSREGFGVIQYGDRIAVAVRRQEDVTADQAETTVERYRLSYGPPTSESSRSSIRLIFWYDDIARHRLMVAVVPDATQRSRFDTTEALGDTIAMDALRMNPLNAEEDRSVGLERWEASARKEPSR